MGKFKKKRLIVEVMLVSVLVGGIGYKLTSVPKEQEKAEEKSKTVAMYVEGEDGIFQISNSKTFPTEGYVLDHAECRNGSMVTQDPSTKRIHVKLSHNDACNLYFTKERIIEIAYGLKANTASVINYNDGDIGELYTFDHDAAEQTTGWTTEERRDYRYIGATPNNWIRFNNEDWRIIGVFTVEKEDGTKEQLLKIIRNESIGNIERNSSTNRWQRSSLNTLLNTGDYYNRVSSYSSTGLNEMSKNQIEEVKWYLGGSSTYQDLGGPNYYSFERGTTVISGYGTNATGKVGLMYPSDYVYTYSNGVDNICYTVGYNCKTDSGGTPSSGWLFNSASQWIISPSAGSSQMGFHVSSAGSMSTRNVTGASGVRPVVYLKSDIQIKSGSGASEDPYIIG